MNSLQVNVSDKKEENIYAIARHINAHFAENWQSIFQTNYDELLDAYREMGDMAYGKYCQLLFQPINEHFRQAGLRPVPRFPGKFSISREWGPDDDRQRWMWSAVSSTTGGLLGTIVTVLFHDHTQFRIPRPPHVFALTETSKRGVAKTLSDLSNDFGDAVEAKIETAEYMKSLRESSADGESRASLKT